MGGAGGGGIVGRRERCTVRVVHVKYNVMGTACKVLVVAMGPSKRICG
jgi:hypothetical protein